MAAFINVQLQFPLSDDEDEEIELENYRMRYALRIERVRYRSKSVYRLSDGDFHRIFRVSKDVFKAIIDELTPHMRSARRSDGLSIEKKIASTIAFLAQGSYQRHVGNDFVVGMSQPSVSKSMKAVIQCMNTVLCPKYIRFPTSNEERNKIKLWFMHKYKIPNCIGAVDGTQIGIFPPSTKNINYPEHIYVNRKGFHSINVQLIVDHTYKIVNINAIFPGCTHDSHIWRMSRARQHLQTVYRENHEWILGDSGYPLEPWLLTPFPNATTVPQEGQFNIVHSKARSLVERAIGVYKGRWRCLCKQRMLHYAPSTCSLIINACAALHNICLEYRDFLPDTDMIIEPNENEVVNFGIQNTLFRVGNANRAEVMASIAT